MTILITRPVDFSTKTEQQFKAAGYDTWKDPVLTIERFPVKIDFDVYDAVITTSMVAIHACAQLRAPCALPFFCAGKASAEFAKDQGFSRVFHPNEPGAMGIFPLICASEYNRFVYIHGETIKVDLASELRTINRSVDCFCVYKTTPCAAWHDDTLRLFHQQKISAITFFSEKSAQATLDLMDKHQLTRFIPHIRALCISDAVADVVRSYGWRSIEYLGEDRGSENRGSERSI